MSKINETIAGLEFAQVGWVVPDIHASVKFLESSLGISFPEIQQVRAQDLNMSYKGKVVPSDCLTTQAYNGVFIELIQPLKGESMFRDYLDKFPAGGVQHMAFRTQVSEFERVCGELLAQGYEMISDVDHPIARMAFFDTYQTLGLVTEIMGITPEGWKILGKMEGKNG